MRSLIQKRAGCLFLAALNPASREDPGVMDEGAGSEGMDFGRYELLEEIARGGMGIVYRARQTQINRIVAVKVMAAGKFASSDFLQRFRTEAEAAASLEHPNIVPIYEVGEWNGQSFYSMKFLEGGTLAKGILQGKPELSNREMVELMVTLSRAVHFAHQRGILHRDIKPDNVLLDGRGVPHLSDFGLAKLMERDSLLTRTEAMLGTPSYMSPEQGRGEAKALTTAVDVYGLGAVFYQVLTGQPPFKGSTAMETVRLLLESEPPRPSSLKPGVDRDLETICLKCLEKEPLRRYGSAEALAEDLDRWLRQEPIQARPQSAAYRFKKAVLRNKLLFGLGTAVLTSLVLGLAFSTSQMLRALKAEKSAIIEAARANQLQLRADKETEAARNQLYISQMHLGLEVWSEHRGLSRLLQLLKQWIPNGDERDRRGWEWYYLNSLPYQNLQTLTKSGSSKGPCTIRYHLASKRLAEGTADGLFRIWAVGQDAPILVVQAAKPWIDYWGGRWFDWSPDGHQIASGCEDGTVHLWNSRTGEELKVFTGHRSSVLIVEFASDGRHLAGWGRDGHIIIWDVDSGEMTFEVVHPSELSAGDWSLDGRFIASGCSDGTVSISTVQEGSGIKTFQAQSDFIYHVEWSPDGSRLASTSANDFFVNVWDVGNGERVLGPLRHSHGITSMAWAPDGLTFATGSLDETVKIWNMVTGREMITLRGHVNAITSVSWGPDGQLASGGADGSLRIWNSIQSQESKALSGHGERVMCVAWSPNGKWLASGGDDGFIRIWDSTQKSQVMAIQGHDTVEDVNRFGVILSVAWSPEGKYLASCGQDGTLKVWDIFTQEEIFAWTEDHGCIWSVSWNSLGTQLAAGCEDGNIGIVTLSGDSPTVQTFRAHTSWVRALSWNPSGNQVASGGWMDTLIRLWDPSRGIPLGEFHGAGGAILGMSWSADGTRIAGASSDFNIPVWDAQTRQRVSLMTGHNDHVNAVSFIGDRSRLASAGFDSSVRIWDPSTGEETFTLRGGHGTFYDVSWSPDGNQLAGASSDGNVWVWDASSGFEQARLKR